MKWIAVGLFCFLLLILLSVLAMIALGVILDLLHSTWLLFLKGKEDESVTKSNEKRGENVGN